MAFSPAMSPGSEPYNPLFSTFEYINTGIVSSRVERKALFSKEHFSQPKVHLFVSPLDALKCRIGV